ncbi:hypothetical protein C7256_28300 [Enterocloster lavalensis]|nr:hypothetical protein C7256_28300 [Enterocloster lavalensis]
MFCSDFRYNGRRIPNQNIVTFLKTHLLFFMQKNVFFTKTYKYLKKYNLWVKPAAFVTKM